MLANYKNQQKKLREVIAQLKKASKTHLQQANKLEKLLKRSVKKMNDYKNQKVKNVS